MICTSCKEETYRQESGRLPSGGKRYVDETGRMWNHRQCPNCKYASKPARVPNTMRRLCRVCEKSLPAMYYFNHPWCKAEIEYLDWSEVCAVNGASV